MTVHVPVRPSWMCGGCPTPWPCHTRRHQLLAEYAAAPVSLGLYLGGCLVDATRDLADVPAGRLYVRFVGWIGPGAPQ